MLLLLLLHMNRNQFSYHSVHSCFPLIRTPTLTGLDLSGLTIIRTICRIYVSVYVCRYNTLYKFIWLFLHLHGSDRYSYNYRYSKKGTVIHYFSYYFSLRGRSLYLPYPPTHSLTVSYSRNDCPSQFNFYVVSGTLYIFRTHSFIPKSVYCMLGRETGRVKFLIS